MKYFKKMHSAEQLIYLGVFYQYKWKISRKSTGKNINTQNTYNPNLPSRKVFGKDPMKDF